MQIYSSSSRDEMRKEEFYFNLKKWLQPSVSRRRRRLIYTFPFIFSFLINRRYTSSPVWPDVGVKSSPNVSKSCPKSSSSSFYARVRIFKITQKVYNHLGYFCYKFVTEIFKKSPNLVTLLLSFSLSLSLSTIFFSTQKPPSILIIKNSYFEEPLT